MEAWGLAFCLCATMLALLALATHIGIKAGMRWVEEAKQRMGEKDER